MIDFASEVRRDPFEHTSAPAILPSELCASALDWLEHDAPWELRVESFYEQWELHINPNDLPIKLRALGSESTVERLTKKMITPLCSGKIELNEITAHKLVAGQTIKVHNDFLIGGETYRLLIQLNRGWLDDQGGMLMLFSSSSSDDVRRVIRPLHRSAFAFGITPHSFHAVSTIYSGERYTIVYSFRGGAPTGRHD